MHFSLYLFVWFSTKIYQKRKFIKKKVNDIPQRPRNRLQLDIFLHISQLITKDSDPPILHF